MGLVLPDTMFSPEKEKTRRFLLEHTTIEKVLRLGPDWFGSDVRMAPSFCRQSRKRPLAIRSCIRWVLAGESRRQHSRVLCLYNKQRQH